MFSRIFRLACAGVLAAAAALTGPAYADTYPSKPIRIVVPFPAGGTADILARILGEKMSASLGQPVVVENRAGAAGAIGAALVAKAPADGYTLFMGTTGTQTINPAVNPKVGYDPLEDFDAVSNFAASPFVLVAHPGLAAKTLPELIALARAQPGKLQYASFGTGSSAHMTGEMFRVQAQVDIVHVPYKGAPPALADVVGGHVPMMFSLLPAVLQQVRSGHVRALAVAAQKRDPALPDVPTFIESGLPGFVSDSWYGVLAPAGTPRPIVAKLNAEIQRVLELPDVRQRLAQEGAVAVGNTPEAFQAQIRGELERWKKIAREAKVTLQ